MLALFVALKYLIPRRRSLSTSLISILSIAVISLVVWLVLVFLSVVSGIENNWIHKLVSLNAPIRLSPTEEYYHSYFYQADQFSEEAEFSLKTIGEKAEVTQNNPFSQEKDVPLPSHLPAAEYKKDDTLLDPVKKAYEILQKKKLVFQDYEISGALLKLTLHRGDANISYLSQMSYLLSLPDKNPQFASLLLPPTSKDLSHLAEQIAKNRIPSSLSTLFDSLHSPKVKIKAYAPFPLSALMDGTWKVNALIENDKVEELYLSDTPKKGYVSALLSYNPAEGNFRLERKDTPLLTLSRDAFCFLQESPLFDASFHDDTLVVQGELQGNRIETPLPAHLIEIANASLPPLTTPKLWAIASHKKLLLPTLANEETPVLLPKALQESGVLIGDRGVLSYATSSLLSTKEQKIPIYVAGFYDTGVFPIGNRFLVVPHSITRTINSASQVLSSDGTPTNGIYVWLDKESRADSVKKELAQAFQEEGIDRFWKISTFREYEFSKDLMEQFQSDRTLFMLIATIILTVACSNVISLLVLLVNDKKKEIAILQSMGCTKKSIALIFGVSGMIMGTLSSLIGSVSAIFTLKHLNFFVEILNKIQGHTAFNPAFYGNSLPNALSYEALLFILIITPLLSLISGLVPAIKAAKLHPSAILRASE